MRGLSLVNLIYEITSLMLPNFKLRGHVEKAKLRINDVWSPAVVAPPRIELGFSV